MGSLDVRIFEEGIHLSLSNFIPWTYPPLLIPWDAIIKFEICDWGNRFTSESKLFIRTNKSHIIVEIPEETLKDYEHYFSENKS